MALVDHHQVEEVPGKLPVDVVHLALPGQPLVERQVDLELLLHLMLSHNGHLIAEVAEVARPGLVQQDVAVRQEEDALFKPRFPKLPDDLKGREGLARAGGHHQQYSILPFRHRLHRPVDRHDLVVARLLSVLVFIELVGDHLFHRIVFDALVALIPLPQFLRRGKAAEGDLSFNIPLAQGFVVLVKAVSVGAVGEEQVQHLGVLQRLLHAGAYRQRIFLCLDHCNGDVVDHQDVICPFRRASLIELPADVYPSFGELVEGGLPKHLGMNVPAGLLQSRGDVLHADVDFGKLALHFFLLLFFLPLLARQFPLWQIDA